MSQAPLFSILVPTYNSAGVVGGLLASIAEQNFRDFEVVVIDGASTDNTLAIVQAFAAKLGLVRMLSRPDGGVYHAINRGIAAARGRWVLILGADDRLHAANTLEEAAGLLATREEWLVYGDVMVIGRNAMVADGARYGGPFSRARLLGQNICQQGVFYRRGLFQRIGSFDLRYRIWADWEFALRATSHLPSCWIDLIIADYSASGLSSTREDEVFKRDYPRLLARLCLGPPWSIRWALACVKSGYWRLCQRLRHRRPVPALQPALGLRGPRAIEAVPRLTAPAAEGGVPPGDAPTGAVMPTNHPHGMPSG